MQSGESGQLVAAPSKRWGCLPCAVLLDREVDAVVLLVEERQAGRWWKTGLCANHAEVLDRAVIGQAQEQYLKEVRHAL